MGLGVTGVTRERIATTTTTTRRAWCVCRRTPTPTTR
jgi:hypothetical protein